MNSPKTLSIIGTAGRGDDKAKLTAPIFQKMCEQVEAICAKENITHLVSGGAAWGDHVAVALFLKDPEKYKLTLYLPCAWVNSNFYDNGVYDYDTNPGGTSKSYHRTFSQVIGRDTLKEIDKAIQHPNCVYVPGSGLLHRNEDVAKSDAVVALTFSDGSQVKDGGTAKTTTAFLTRKDHGPSWHVNLSDFKVHSPATVSLKEIEGRRRYGAPKPRAIIGPPEVSKNSYNLGQGELSLKQSDVSKNDNQPQIPRPGMAMEEIVRFYGIEMNGNSPKNWFTNMAEFSPPIIDNLGVSYRHVETFFQAQKTSDIKERQTLAASSPYDAKKIGKTVQLRPDWEQVKLGVMEQALQHKFTKDIRWGSMLVASDPKTLVEINTWGDREYGYDMTSGKGENKLGLMLAKIRETLIAQKLFPEAVPFAPNHVDRLAKNQVFVFGSNSTGFHGAGSAGYALKGTGANDWRTNPEFEAIQKSSDKKGRWAVLGQARGYQEGTQGASYPIVTVEKPGEKGFVTLDTIASEVESLCRFAAKMPEKEFLVAKIGLSREYGGFSFFTPDDMRMVFAQVHAKVGIPKNVHLPRSFEVRFGQHVSLVPNKPSVSQAMPEVAKITVRNKKDVPTLGENDFYIGRSGSKPSSLANPFTHLPIERTSAVFQVSTRDQSVSFFKAYVLEMLQLADKTIKGQNKPNDPMEIFDRIVAMPGITGFNSQAALELITPERAVAMRNEMRAIADKAKIAPIQVVCHCAPQGCHGDIIKSLIEKKLNKDIEVSRSALTANVNAPVAAAVTRSFIPELPPPPPRLG